MRFSFVPKSDISVIGKQTADILTSYRTSNKGEVSLLEQGKVDAAEMFARAHEANALMTWILRAVGVFLMFL